MCSWKISERPWQFPGKCKGGKGEAEKETWHTTLKFCLSQNRLWFNAAANNIIFIRNIPQYSESSRSFISKKCRWKGVGKEWRCNGVWNYNSTILNITTDASIEKPQYELGSISLWKHSSWNIFLAKCRGRGARIGGRSTYKSIIKRKDATWWHKINLLGSDRNKLHSATIWK